MDRLSSRSILERLLFYLTISSFLVWWSKARKTPTHIKSTQIKQNPREPTSQNSIYNQSLYLLPSPFHQNFPVDILHPWATHQWPKWAQQQQRSTPSSFRQSRSTNSRKLMVKEKQKQRQSLWLLLYNNIKLDFYGYIWK